MIKGESDNAYAYVVRRARWTSVEMLYIYFFTYLLWWVMFNKINFILPLSY